LHHHGTIEPGVAVAAGVRHGDVLILCDLFGDSSYLVSLVGAPVHRVLPLPLCRGRRVGMCFRGDMSDNDLPCKVVERCCAMGRSWGNLQSSRLHLLRILRHARETAPCLSCLSTRGRCAITSLSTCPSHRLSSFEQRGICAHRRVRASF
jgi:hypothetical protein